MRSHVIQKEIETVLGKRSDVQLVIDLLGQISQNRVFEAEQLNLHSESRIAGHVILEAVVSAVKILRSQMNSEDNVKIIMEWIFDETKYAIDILYISAQMKFDGISGGASFDQRVFLWCESILNVGADMFVLCGQNTDSKSIELQSGSKKLLQEASNIHPLLEKHLTKFHFQ